MSGNTNSTPWSIPAFMPTINNNKATSQSVATAATNGQISKQQVGEGQQALAEWRSIQDAVQLTLKAFFDALRTQGDAIKGLERGQEQVAASIRTEMASALRGKAGHAELAGRMKEIETLLCSKADISDMERRPIRGEVDASLKTQMSDVTAYVKAKCDESATKAWQESCDRQLAGLRSDVARLCAEVSDIRSVLVTKANDTDVRGLLATKADVADVDQRLREKASKKLVSELLATKADSTAFDKLSFDTRARLAEMDASLHKKTDISISTEIDRRVDKLSNRMDADAQTTAINLQALSTKLLAAVDSQVQVQQAHQADVEQALAGLQATMAVQDKQYKGLLATKADTAQVADVAATTIGLERNMAAVTETITNTKTSLELRCTTLCSDLAALLSRVETLSRDVSEGIASQSAVTEALDSKANTENVNAALTQVCDHINTRAATEQLEEVSGRLDALSTSLTRVTSHSEARWLWKTNRLLTGGQVPWDVQAINSSPAMYLWEAGQPCIVAALPGLYQLSMSFFASTRPIIQVCVNSEIIMTVTGPCITTSSSACTASHAFADAGKPHSAGNVVGMSATEFVSLPGNARLSVLYQGDPIGCEGFLQLRKL